jgi:hypothetical protein
MLVLMNPALFAPPCANVEDMNVADNKTVFQLSEAGLSSSSAKANVVH